MYVSAHAAPLNRITNQRATKVHRSATISVSTSRPIFAASAAVGAEAERVGGQVRARIDLGPELRVERPELPCTVLVVEEEPVRRRGRGMRRFEEHDDRHALRRVAERLPRLR